MKRELIQKTVDELDNDFDSNAFIRKFVALHQQFYIRLLVNYAKAKPEDEAPFDQVHLSVMEALRDSGLAQIYDVPKPSVDFFGRPGMADYWMKTKPHYPGR